MPRSTAEASLSMGALRERWMPFASHQVTVSARTPLAFNSAARAARSVLLTGAPSDGCSTVRSREGTPCAVRREHASVSAQPATASIQSRFWLHSELASDGAT